MLTREQVERLSRIQSDRFPVVSLYLNLPRDVSQGTEVIALKNFLQEAEEEKRRWKGEAQTSLERDLERIQALVQEERMGGARALAVFACHALGDWHTFRSYLPVANRLEVASQAYLKPLLRLLDVAGRYAVALVDKSRSRLLLVTANGAEELADLQAPVPGKHDQGGWSQARFQRHHEDHVHRHLKQTAEELLRLQQSRSLEGLFISGPESVIDQFREELHPYLREILAGELRLPMAAPAREIYERALQRILEMEHEEEQMLVEELRSQVGRGDLGVAGLEPTLQALQRGQVRLLLVDSQYRRRGWRCRECGILTVQDQTSCPYCQGSMVEVRDVIAEAVEAAFSQEAEVHFVEADAQDGSSPMAQLGHLGAILRYPISESPEGGPER